MQANSGDPDQTPRNAAFDLGFHCLPMSHKKDSELIWVKATIKQRREAFSCSDSCVTATKH